MPENLQAELAKITQQPQRQDSSLDQLRDLHAFANKLGLYDAADLIRNMTTHPQHEPSTDGQTDKDHAKPLNMGEEAAQFKAWFDPWWLKSSAPCKTIPTNADKHFLTYLNQYTPAFYAWVASKNARPGPANLNNLIQVGQCGNRF